ncbi:hypothetical protein M514_26458 [Trichuris suis]|uniref:Uncharacterized protein n=1 Tax=Trichuris suis TaxID=68888 RepID=A0A085MVS9_9BILA|nr:hypothetical protein M514_26458 [Trichuris suis]
MKSLTRYRNAVNRLNAESSNISRGRPPKLDPRDAMEQAIQTSAVAQHATQCTGQLRAKRASFIRRRGKCDSLHRTRPCNEPEQCAACSAIADAASARSMAIWGGTDEGLPRDGAVVFELLFSLIVSTELSHVLLESAELPGLNLLLKVRLMKEIKN